MTRHANIFKRGKLIATIAETGEGFVQFSYDNLWRTTESDPVLSAKSRLRSPAMQKEKQGDLP